MERIPQSVTKRVSLKAYLSSDGISDATSKTIAIVISKNGAAFGNPSAGATNATESGLGWYYVDLSTTDTATAGPLIVRGTSTGVDNAERIFTVADAHNGGFDGVPSAVAGASGGLPLSVDASGRVDVLKVNGTSQTARDLGANLDVAVSTRTKPADTQARVTLVDTVTTYTGNTPQTGDNFARIGVAGAGLTALGDTRIAHMDADVSSRTKPADTQAAVTTVTDKTGFSLSTAGILAIWHQLTSAIVTASTIGKLIVDFLDAAVSSRPTASDNAATLLVSAVGFSTVADKLSTLPFADAGTAGGMPILDINLNLSVNLISAASVLAGSANTITLDFGLSSVDDTYKGNIVFISAGAGAGQSRVVVAYNGTTKVATLDRDWVTVPTEFSVYKLYVAALPRTNADLDVALTSAYDPAKTAAQAGDAMALTSGERTTLVAAVWAAAGRTLTSFGTLVSDAATAVWGAVTRSLTDKAGFSLTSAYDAAKTAGDATAANQTTINGNVLTRLAASGYTSPDNAGIASIESAVTALPTATANADALLDRTAGVETGWTIRQAMRIILGVLAGKTTGANTASMAFRDTADTKNRVAVTLDTNGNRTAVSTDAS